ncbi:copper transporter [Nonomuraea longicatena]|uniref:Copper transporter n=1 Tax=Nonomuraea longicatena TaxID=83682 RepID=A0ABP3ZE90_9ACTN
MIDFRYHLVSIVAIFLALSVGIVLGTTLLKDPAIHLAEASVENVTKNNAELRAEIDVLTRREGGNDAFIANMTPDLAKVGGGLTGKRVVLVEAPGASTALTDQQQQVLEQAGAVVSGRVVLTEKFVAPASAGVLDQLVTQLKPAELNFAANAGVHDKAAQLLAAAVVTKDPAQAGTPDPDTAAVLGALETGGFLTVRDEPAKRATLAVLIAPERPFEGEQAEAQADEIVALAGGLDAGGQGSVMAGTEGAIGPGGAITALRESSELAKRVSTVDVLDMPMGRVTVVYALREQLDGRAGQYGVLSGATQPQPPVAAPTPSSTSSGS